MIIIRILSPPRFHNIKMVADHRIELWTQGFLGSQPSPNTGFLLTSFKHTNVSGLFQDE
jgi:hypothetical protein